METETISPELALVDAEMRRRAISALPMPRWDVSWQPRGMARTGRTPVPRLVAAVVYFAVGLGHALVWGLAVVGLLAVFAGIGFFH